MRGERSIYMECLIKGARFFRQRARRIGMSTKQIVAGVALLGLGAAGALTAMHIRVGWGPTAQAAPAGTVPVAQATLPPPTAAQVADARAMSRTFAQVASQVGPAVVRISVTQTVKGQRFRTFGPFGGNPFHGTPFDRFFDQDEGQEGQ